jgi:hypothetical protein
MWKIKCKVGLKETWQELVNWTAVTQDREMAEFFNTVMNLRFS